MRGRAFRLRKKREHYEHDLEIKELRKKNPKYKLTKQEALERSENGEEETSID